MVSILNSIKKLLGLDEADSTFDLDIIICINTCISTLTQLGVGPPDGFYIMGATETWQSFLGERKDLEMIKGYVFLNTRLMFDPPQNSFLVKTFEDQTTELKWRIKNQAS